MKSRKPFFSIGVTAYKRPDLLRQCVNSILRQTFSDFEILIGNDDPSSAITSSSLGILDNRIKIFNHAQNMGEVGNMNYLLSKANGDYFTWLADDDLFEPQYLEQIHSVIRLDETVDCIYTKFQLFRGQDYPFSNRYPLPQPIFEGGSEFIHHYLKGKHQIISVYGMFRKDKLQSMGGMKDLSGAPIGLFGEYFLILSILPKLRIAYINNPLVVYRVPEGSRGVYNNCNYEHCKIASEELILLGGKLFSKPEMKEYFNYNMTAIINLCLSNTLSKSFKENGKIKLVLDIGSFFLHIVRLVRKDTSVKYAFVVGLLLVRGLIIQIAYSYLPSVGKKSVVASSFLHFATLIGLVTLFGWIFPPPIRFWDDNDTVTI